jgi:Sybindin-like family
MLNFVVINVAGIKIVVTSTVAVIDVDALLQGLYEIYTDYVLKVIHLLA